MSIRPICSATGIKTAGPIGAALGMGPAQQGFDADDAPAMRGDDRLIVQFQFARRERARQFALDEFLVRRHGIDRVARTRRRRRAPSCRPRAARDAARRSQFVAGGGVARRLRVAGMRADPHLGVDPLRTRRSPVASTRSMVRGIGSRRRSDRPRTRRCRCGRTWLRPADILGAQDRFGDETRRARSRRLRVDVVHAVEFDQREGRHFCPARSAIASDRATPASWRGWAGRSACLRRRRGAPAARSPPVRAARGATATAKIRRSRPARWRSPAMNGISRCIASIIGCALSQVRKPAMRPCASITGCISRSPGGGSVSNLRPLRPTLCSTMRMKRGSTASDLSEQIAEFADRVAQRGALLGPQPFVALVRQAIADDAAQQSRAHGERREHDHKLRGRQHPPGMSRGAPASRRAAGAAAFEKRQQRAAGLVAHRLRFDLAVQ